MKHHEDTIAAIATPIGVGGLSVIRISGRDAFNVADRVFQGRTALKSVQTHSAHLGYLIDVAGQPIDEVVAVVYKEPHSYTAEDSVEISCHGGILVTQKALEAILQSGARLAEPGEFTKRAFLNGRLDLSQAEAVAELIHSRSELSRKSSFEQLQGKLSQVINGMRDDLIQVSSLLELELDFAEEDIELANKQEVSKRLTCILADIDMLIESFGVGQIYREGVKVVISGKPNVGKSSLLNALLNENRAIVTEIPGTTRDTIEESISLEGILFRLVDTAGLRDTVDIVEREGVRRTQSQIASSDLILMVLDSSQPIDNADSEVFETAKKGGSSLDNRCIVVLNKIDLANNAMSDYLNVLGIPKTQPVVKVSALSHEGLDSLKKALVRAAFSDRGRAMEASTTVTNARHREALTRARGHLMLALESLNGGKSGEFITFDSRAALDYLGEIVGTVTTEDILNNVFSRFCIGK